jgi:adhesin transport system membrane fusion protein
MSSGGLYSSEDLRYMPDVEAAVRRRGNRFAYALTIMTFVFIVTMLIWAHFAVLDEVTRGEGTVIPSSKTQVIQNLEGGILAEVLVREGDIVEKGDILVRIDNTAAQASFRDLQSQYFVLLASIARMEAELESRELVMPEEVLQEAPAAAANQTALFRLRQDQLRAQIRVPNRRPPSASRKSRKCAAGATSCNGVWTWPSRNWQSPNPWSARGSCRDST